MTLEEIAEHLDAIHGAMQTSANAIAPEDPAAGYEFYNDDGSAIPSLAELAAAVRANN